MGLVGPGRGSPPGGSWGTGVSGGRRRTHVPARPGIICLVPRMTAQAVCFLMILGLLIARAVNIFKWPPCPLQLAVGG